VHHAGEVPTIDLDVSDDALVTVRKELGEGFAVLVEMVVSVEDRNGGGLGHSAIQARLPTKSIVVEPFREAPRDLAGRLAIDYPRKPSEPIHWWN